MASVVAIVDDLLALTRLETAASAAGHSLLRTSPERADVEGARLVVVDLDAVGTERLSGLAGPAAAVRTVGFFSHVDEALGAAARAVGIEALPRGRFWRELPELFGGV